MKIFREFERSERNRRVLLYALGGALALSASEPDTIASLVMSVFDRAGEGSPADEIRVTCLRLTTSLNQRENGPLGGAIVDLVLRDSTRFQHLTIHLVQIAAKCLLVGPSVPPDSRADAYRLRSIQILATIARETAEILWLLEEEWKCKEGKLDGGRARSRQTCSLHST